MISRNLAATRGRARGDAARQARRGERRRRRVIPRKAPLGENSGGSHENCFGARRRPRPPCRSGARTIRRWSAERGWAARQLRPQGRDKLRLWWAIRRLCLWPLLWPAGLFLGRTGLLWLPPLSRRPGHPHGAPVLPAADLSAVRAGLSGLVATAARRGAKPRGRPSPARLYVSVGCAIHAARAHRDARGADPQGRRG